ncbi:aromatic-ring-hydroxylating dioxygenase subunit beta [Alloalcanivorax profundimaris]|uniref:aromatic-ring-hydroxylating dioxygenase subunit beta n=1 Tax=Alloalcanivorax profundimaris TaxID=2735259 RepID=UPI001888EA7F|nr:aromatic-ring-hydroxylating dioxygenase subunit beta [Alloalcanivorax profundimaris]MBF1802302.1 aromatic-ring-hydroxylating dioxygenase subunit beta [Alloalcanivorax profundimaris]MCQ6260938.1 aromatic-ring-hydroxylating dioxygenase subunit beta [Alcanivorax sp. MM125-6]
MEAIKKNQAAPGLGQAQLVHAIERFNTDYCRALDEGRLHDWVEFFTEDAYYVVSGRENHTANLPVGLVYCEGKGMLKDRALAILETSMFAPRYLRHFVTNTYAEPQDDGTIVAGANYMLTQVLMDQPTATLHQVGCYLDRFVFENGELKLQERRAIYDNLLLNNDLVYPV